MGWLRTRVSTPVLLLIVLLVGFAVVLGCAIAAGELLALAERPDGSTALDSSITNWVVAHRTSGLTTLARASRRWAARRSCRRSQRSSRSCWW